MMEIPNIKRFGVIPSRRLDTTQILMILFAGVYSISEERLRNS